MTGINKALIVGRLGQDPEVRQLPSGSAVASLSVATSERYTDKQTGEKVERTEWHRVTLFARLAEIAGEYLRKGSLVYIEGRLQTDKYEKDGSTRYTTKIIAQNLQMLGGKAAADDDTEQPSAEQHANRAAARQRSQGAQRTPPAQPEFDDDIPF